jgi:hypothetical protein
MAKSGGLSRVIKLDNTTSGLNYNPFLAITKQPKVGQPWLIPKPEDLPDYLQIPSMIPLPTLPGAPPAPPPVPANGTTISNGTVPAAPVIPMIPTPPGLGCFVAPNITVGIPLGDPDEGCDKGFWCPYVEVGNAAKQKVYCPPQPECGFVRLATGRCLVSST